MFLELFVHIVQRNWVNIMNHANRQGFSIGIELAKKEIMMSSIILLVVVIAIVVLALGGSHTYAWAALGEES
jgi:hypothetical protein